MEAPTTITDTATQEAYVLTGLILQAALGVQTEIFYAYDNANSALYNTATGQLTAAGVAYQQTEQWLTGATEPSGYQLNGSVYAVQLTKTVRTTSLSGIPRANPRMRLAPIPSMSTRKVRSTPSSTAR